MDPQFGLPVVKDTKAMDAARTRNKSQEKHLMKKMATLDLELRSRNCKVHNTVSDLHKFLVDLDPNSSKSVICPRGLTPQQKEDYKQIRKSSVPSMTLEEFDLKLEVKRKKKRAQRSSNQQPEVGGRTGKIVDVDEHSFCAPIQKHRQTMRDAYDRATTNDVKFSETRQEGNSRNDSNRDRSQRRGSSSSGGSGLAPVGFNPDRRRNTVCGSSVTQGDSPGLDPALVELLKSKMAASTMVDSEDDDH